jgi:integrase
MSLWKRGNVYWSYLWMDGIRYAQSTGTGNRRQALTIEQRFQEELNLKRHQIVQPTPHISFGELAARFLAEGGPRPWHIDRLKLLLPYWCEVPIGRIHKSMTDDYRRRRHAAKTVTDTTINRDLEALRHILFWAVDEGLLMTNPLSRLRLTPERRKPRTVLPIDDEARLLAAAADHLGPIIIAALDTGMRRGELLHQRWEHIDWNRSVLFVTQSKTAGGEAREIPFTERVRALLQAHRQPQGLVFTFHENPIHQIKTAWKAAIRRAAIRYYRFHDLRHTFNTRLMEAGVMQEVRKALMGHSSGEDVNSIYTHVELPAKREAIRKLEAWVRQQQLEQERKGGAYGNTEDSGPGTGTVDATRSGNPEALEEEDPGRGRPRPDRSAKGRRN